MSRLRRLQLLFACGLAGFLTPLGAQRQAQRQAVERPSDTPESWQRVGVEAAGLRFFVPGDFEKLPARAFLPLHMRGKLGGASVELRVTWLTKSFATVSRAMLAITGESKLLRVRGTRLCGEVAAQFECRTKQKQERVGLLICPRFEALAIEILAPGGSPPTTRAACRRLLRFVRLVPRRGLTVVRDEVETRKRRAIEKGFTEADQKNVRVRESPHYRLFTTAPVDEQLLKLLERELLPRVVAICGVKCKRERPLPIFLHKRRSAYVHATMRLGLSAQQAEAMEGHAWDQYYATWYSGPRDPVHIHEGTHQYVTATLKLDGGGPWLQEGFARWIETQYSRETPARNARNLLKTHKRFPSLRTLLGSRSFLLASHESLGLGTAQLYDVAASFVQFLAQEHRARFRDVFLQCGVLPSARASTRLVIEALETSLDVSIQQLEADWKRWLREDL